LRFTVDEQSDFDVVKTIFEKLYPINKDFSAIEVVNFLNSNPNILDINKHVVQRTLPAWDKFK
jgi:spore coat polysaccharide biosynthesis protein SpsF